jgi:hypothetical protein
MRLNPSDMNLMINKLLNLSILALSVGFLGTANAEAFKVTTTKPAFDDLQSPEFNNGKQKAFKPKNWLEVEAKLNVIASPDYKFKTVDKITVKWYVAVQNPEKARSMLLFTRDIDHVNIPLNEDIHCSVYLSPSAILRITGSDRAAKSMVEYVGYEVLINGVKVGEETSKGSPGWWNVNSEKISRSDAVPLLSKPETPFNIMWWDRYAEVAPVER